MKKTITTLFVTAFLGFSISTKSQVALYTENFDADTSALPTGWTATTGGWTVKKSNSSSGYTGASGNVNAVIDNTVSNTGSFNLVSKSISTAGYNTITIEWGARLTTHFLDS